MDYDENLYYNPEAHGLKIVDSIDFSSGSYEFDTRVIWTNGKGVYYTARDSGCSCPSPFEDYTGVEMLDRFHLDTLLTEADEDWRENLSADEVQAWKTTLYGIERTRQREIATV